MSVGFAIWWTTQGDCEAIGYSRAGGWDVPKYLAAEFKSRYGRAGRGRLWIADELTEAGCPMVATFPEPATPLSSVIERQSMGGIVIRAVDAVTLRDLPGLVTDFECRRVMELK